MKCTKIFFFLYSVGQFESVIDDFVFQVKQTSVQTIRRPPLPLIFVIVQIVNILHIERYHN